MTSYKLTLILLLLIACCGWYSLTLYHVSPESQATPSKFAQFQEQDVQQITIRQHENKKTLVFKNLSSSWKMLQPHKMNIDQQKVESLLSIFDYGYIDILDITSNNLSTYGLDPPTVSMSIIYKNQDIQHTFDLMIGNDSPNGTSCYGYTANEQKLYLLGILYKERLQQPPSYYFASNIKSN